MIVTLPYSTKRLECEIPPGNLLGVYEPKELPAAQEQEEILRAISNPVGQRPIRKMASAGDRAVIVADDITRKTPVKSILPAILDELNLAGISDDRIDVVVALGTHLPMSEEDNVERFGKAIVERVRIRNHNCHDEKSLHLLGRTPTGIPVWINKQVLEADVKIGVGTIFPHRVAGFSGGSKIIMPGVCGAQTIGITHVNSARFTSEAILGIRDNLIRRDMDYIAEKVGLTAIFNTALNKEGKVARAFCGDFRRAFQEGANFESRFVEIKVPNRSDIVITDSHPYESDFWSSGEKGLTAGEIAVRNGGTVIFAHPCYKGLMAGRAEEEFLSLVRETPDRILHRVETGEVQDLVAAATAAIIGQVRMKANVIMVSEGITTEVASSLGFRLSRSLDDAVEMALRTHGSDAQVCVLRHGAHIVPRIAEP